MFIVLISTSDLTVAWQLYYKQNYNLGNFMLKYWTSGIFVYLELYLYLHGVRFLSPMPRS